MRILIQRVKSARVVVAGNTVSVIGKGLLLFAGIGKEDKMEDIRRLAGKVINLRIFEDDQGKMNLNIRQAGGSILSVSQFTLYADTGKGNRPGFDQSADPDIAKDYWQRFNNLLKDEGIEVREGIFAAHMEVGLVNDGPVTIWLDSRK
ncbi:MAG: D-tyrosyl-tRNA(Tyr) deacylase [Nitrospiraceae bacterium]|nr:MAG: D-tyrosyl-tRNA(Tyr) deacylase [Nitrospiraceae bacterium]